MRHSFFGIVLVLCAGAMTACSVAAAGEAPRPSAISAGARAVCVPDPADELGTALPSLVAGCNVVPPWTEHVPFVHCPDGGCPRPCSKTSNRFGSETEVAVTRYRYDGSGRLIDATRKGADGHVISAERWEYTSPRHWRRTHSVLGAFDYDFDAEGRLVARSSDSLHHVYERGPRGEVVRERVESPGSVRAQGMLFRYGYDGQGRLTAIDRDPPTSELTYGYASTGLLETATLRNREWHLHWDGQRVVGAARGSSTHDDYRLRYDAQGRPIEIIDETGGFDRYDYACKD